jgi:hypothetical protein
MDSFSKDFKFIKYGVGTFATAADQWLMLICLLAAAGLPIRWYVWTLFAIEKLVAIYGAYRYKKETASDV